MNYPRVRQAFNEVIERQDIQKSALAEDLKVSPQIISHYSTGRRRMTEEKIVDIAEYFNDPEFDYEASFELFKTIFILKRQRRDNHPITKLVAQDKEEIERIEAEKKYEIWDLLSIPASEINTSEIEHIKSWLNELIDEIASEIAITTSVCEKYDIDLRKITVEREKFQSTRR